MKKKLMFFAAMCLAVVVLFAGCGIVLQGGPDKNDPVYGNGGQAVRKGEWLYFVNAYKSQETVNVNGNKFGDEKLSGVYRVKLNSSGLINTNADGMPEGAELLVPQITGYENGGIYIFGEYLYYTTPKTLNDKTGVPQRGLCSFERVKLDGTNHKTIYSTSEVSSNLTFSYQQIGNFVYIIIRNGTEIRSIEVGLSNDKVYNRLLAEDVESVAFSKVDKNASNFEQYVYYTKVATVDKDGFDGQKVLRASLNASVKNEVIKSLSEGGVTLTEIKNSRIYYEMGSKLYSTTGFTTSKQYASSGTDKISPYFILPDQNSVDRGILTNFEGKLVRFWGVGNYQEIETGISEVLSVIGEFVYIKKSGSDQIVRMRFDGSGGSQTIIGQASLQIEARNYFDCDGEYLFYFANVEDSKKMFSYLHMVKIGAQNEEGNLFAQFVGVLDKDDIIEEED